MESRMWYLNKYGIQNFCVIIILKYSVFTFFALLLTLP